MADDDDYVETGDANTEPADAPGTVPADTAAPAAAERVAVAKPAAPATFETTAEFKRGANNSRVRESRKAFAEAVLAAKSAPAAAAPAQPVDEFDPEAAPAPAVVPPKPAAPAAAAPVAAPQAPAPAAPAPPAAAIATPPAPSLDPEIRKLREQLKADRDELAAQRAEFEKQKTAPVAAPPDALSIEDYVDRPAQAYRTWLETMRGEKFASDDEFRMEARDFVESISSDVLGVPLPPETRNSLESRMARKAVRVSKTVSARREAEALAKAERERNEAQTKVETERVEQEWGKAGEIIGDQFKPQQGADGKPVQSAAAAAYPWLAVEDEPGKIVVDVIRAALAKDGTHMSWQEASTKANEYLKSEYQTRYEKRKPLLAPAPAAPAPVAAKPAAAPTPPPVAPPKQRLPTEVENPSKWSKEAHLAKSRAAFRRLIDGADKA